uniref:SH3 domain-containing protein n=1 Tax=Eptatretus burgeri TaxID=7764 RepID=A0A8C4QGH0_EPTBU
MNHRTSIFEVNIRQISKIVNSHPIDFKLEKDVKTWLFCLQMQLLDQFPMEGGQRDPKLRTIPFLPGKILFRRSHIRDVAVKRLKPINEYCQALVRLPAHISQCPDVLRFFETRQEDLDRKMMSRWLTACLASRPDTSWDRDGEADGEEQCIAVADYERQQAGEIGLRAGQSVDVLEKSETGWWFVSGVDEQGWVPASFLEPHKEIRDSPPSRKPTDGSVTNILATQSWVSAVF